MMNMRRMESLSESKESTAMGEMVLEKIEHKLSVCAAPDSWFSHLAIEVPGEDTSAEWLEAVSEDNYGKLG